MKSQTRKNRWSKRKDARKNTRGGLSRKEYAEKKAQELAKKAQELAQAPTLKARKAAGKTPTLKVVKAAQENSVQKADNSRVKFEVEFTMRGTKHVGVVYTAYVWGNNTAEVYAKMVARYGNELYSVDMFDPRKQDGVTFEVSLTRELVKEYTFAASRAAV